MSIRERLFPWQKKIIDEFYDRKSLGLFLDMGLGKTPVSLAFAEAHNCTKILIISINSKATETLNDSGSFAEWITKIDNHNFNIYNKKNIFNSFDGPKKYLSQISPSTEDVLILNYESLCKRSKNDLSDDKKKKAPKIQLKENILEFIDNARDNKMCIIIDESHKLKNQNSLQSLAISKIISLCKMMCSDTYVYLLTGTPFSTGYEDLYNQLKILGYTATKTIFYDNFCIRGNLPSLPGWQQPVVGYKNIDKLFELVHRYAITIESDTVIDLPEKVFVNHIIPNNEDMKIFSKEKINSKILNKYCEKRNIILDPDWWEVTEKNKDVVNPFYRNIDYPNEDYFADTSGAFWLRARQLSIGFQGNAEKSTWYNKDRLNKIKEFLETYPDNYILFYNYTPELLELYSICEELGYNIDVYCGEIKSLYFYERYSKLSKEKKLSETKNIIISNFASGSTGKNWQEYSKCIIASIPLYKDFEQGIKRINRFGQKQTTVYHLFYTDNWLDKSMKVALDEAKQYNQDMFNSDLERIQLFMED